jgi:hypothetical protein
MLDLPLSPGPDQAVNAGGRHPREAVEAPKILDLQFSDNRRHSASLNQKIETILFITSSSKKDQMLGRPESRLRFSQPNCY